MTSRQCNLGSRYFARFIFATFIVAIAAVLVDPFIFGGHPAGAAAERSVGVVAKPELQTDVHREVIATEMAANELKAVATVSRWYTPQDFLSQRKLLTFRVSLTPTGNLTSGSATITLPSFLRYDGHDHAGFSYVSFSSSGQTVSVTYSSGSSATGFNGWEARIFVRVSPLELYPDIPPTGEVRFTGSSSGPGGSGSFDIISPTGLAYTKPKWSRVGSGAVAPGDEVTYKIETKNYPHAVSTSATIRFAAPPNTTLVAGSVTGIDGGTVTQSTPDHYQIDWGAAGRDHTVTYRIRVKPDTPANVTTIMHLHGGSGYYPIYSWQSVGVGGLEFPRPSNLTFPLTHTGVALTMDVPDKRFEVGDQFPATIKVSSTSQQPRTVTFTDPLLIERPISGVSVDSILGIDPYPLPAPFELTTANPSRTFIVLVKINKLGITELVSSLSFTGPGGIQGTKTVAKKISAPPFDVTVEVTPKQTVYNQTAAVKKTERCRALEAASPIKVDPETGAEVREVANCIEITVKVKNLSEKTITNVNIPDAATPLKLINEIDPKILGEPLKELEHVFPASPVTLAAGGEAVWIWRMNAFEGPAFLEFEPIVYGVMNGQEVSGHGNKEFKIIKNVLLKWGMRPTQGRTDYPSGASVRADGYIENLSMKDGGEKKLLRVMVYQMLKKNIGGGFVFDVLKSGQASEPDTYQIFDVEAEGDLKRINLGSVFRTMRTAAASSGEIRFGVRMWIVEDDGKLTPATDQAQLDDEDGYTDEFFVFLSPEQVIPDVFKEQCLATGFRPIICSFNEGLYGEAVPGMYGLLQFAYSGVEGTGEGIARMGVYNARLLRELMKAAMDDPAAKKFIMDEAYQTYKTYHDLGVLAGQVPGQAAMGFEAFSIQTVGGIDKYLRAIDEGDITAVEEMTGHFFGANPDLLIEPLAVARSYAVMARSLKKAGTGIADNVVTASARNKAIREQAEVDTRLAAAKANPNVSDLSSALASGDVLTPRLMVQVFGVDAKTLKRIEDFARENRVILAFRSRSDIAQSLLNRNLAWPKPQALKHKTVNEIDIKYFGYRNESKGILEIVEPPAGIAGKTDETGLKEALDEHMAKLVAAHPELQNNHVLRFEVRDRLKTRAEEWNKYCPQLGVGDAPNTVDVGVSFEADKQWARDVSGDIGPKEYRKVTTKPDGKVVDATGEERRVWTLEMEGPNGQPARSVTGDIDFLAILDERGLAIQDDDKLIALYKQLSEMGLMEHGESMSFRLQKARLEHLSCCIDGVPGSEAMMTVGPWDGPPRAGRFVENLTIMNELNAKYRRVHKTEIVRDKAGKIEYDANGKPKTVTIRHENTNGEFALINGMPHLNYADDAFVAHFIPLLLDDVYAEFKSRIKYYFPGLIARFLGGEELGYGSSTAPQAAIFRRGGPVLQLEPVSEIDLIKPDKLRIWTRETGWQPITREAAIAAGEPGVSDVAPNTSLSEGASAGSSTLTVTPQSFLDATGDFITPADVIVINPGGTNQETAIVLSVNPIVLTAPLAQEHEAGEMVAVIEAGAPVANVTISGRVTGPDGRGMSNVPVTLSGTGGKVTVNTSSFGLFTFANVVPGQAYTVIVTSKRFKFIPKPLSVTGDLANVDFVGRE